MKGTGILKRFFECLFHPLGEDTPDTGHANPRIEAFDIMRGLAIVFMIMVHVLMIYGKPEAEESVSGIIIEFFGSPPAAPVFMFLMGLFFVRSRKNREKQNYVRGIKLIALGFALNFVRGYLPFTLALKMKVFTLNDVSPCTPQDLLITIDILLFAGLAYVILTIIVHWIKRPIGWIAITLTIMVVSPYLWGIKTGIGPIDTILEMLWGEKTNTAFPLFPWLVYPLFGMVLNSLISSMRDRDAFLKRSTLVGSGMMIAGLLLSITNTSFHFGDYYRMGFGGHMSIFGFLLLWNRLFWFLSSKLKDLKLLGFFRFLSRNITTVYVIHWCIIGWGVLVFNFKAQSTGFVLLGTVAVTVLSVLCTRLYNHLSQTLKNGTRSRNLGINVQKGE